MPEERLPCSVVLEGGVTSAVIYAGLLARLSRHYRFRDLGGTSSGAVAAAAAAAAEYGRQAHPDTAASFAGLRRFPGALSASDHGRTRLLRLFEPSEAARPALDVALSWLNRSGRETRSAIVVRGLGALLAHYPQVAVALGLMVLAFAATVAHGLAAHGCGTVVIDRLLWCTLSWGILVSPAVVTAVLLLGVWALVSTVRALRANHWGLCSGMGSEDALSPVLHELLQTLSGLPPDKPLTFGDLWDVPQPERVDATAKPEPRGIDLQVVTTSVCVGRPVLLPGPPGTNPLKGYFYDPVEWGRLFPPKIMDHLATHAPAAGLPTDDGRTLQALPEPRHWPVLLAARLSLSFPILLSAVPMSIAVPRRERLRAGGSGPPLPFEARKVYFSDGGITSNCPIHLFDVPLPGFPTFGVNLYRLPKGHARSVVRSDTVDPELEAQATPDAATWCGPWSFLRQIFTTAMDWRDGLQRGLPGYRERIVNIGLPRDEGGLNLMMSPNTIRRLAALGRVAAGVLRRDFSTPRRSGEANAWERHRWTRTRSTLRALRAYLDDFARRLPAGEPSYLRLLQVASPANHPLDDDARRQAQMLADGAAALSARLAAEPDALGRHAPEPAPTLNLTPPL